MSLKSRAFGIVLTAASSLAACATNPDRAHTALAAAPTRGDEVLVRNLHATPRYRGGPPLSSIYYKRQPRS